MWWMEMRGDDERIDDHLMILYLPLYTHSSVHHDYIYIYIYTTIR